LKLAEEAVYKSVFLTIWRCILSAKLIKTHSFRLFFGDLKVESPPHHWSSAMRKGDSLFRCKAAISAA